MKFVQLLGRSIRSIAKFCFCIRKEKKNVKKLIADFRSENKFVE